MSGTLRAADDEHWLDVEGQIQYSYYTEEQRALTNLGARLDLKEGAQPLQGYYAGLAYFRLALTRESADKSGAAQASEHCVASLDQALQARADWAEALALEPHNPRVLLLDGWLDREHPGRAAAPKARGCEKFAAAIAAFEAARPGEEHVPEWGPAEGYTYRAQCDFERGDAAAARDALERALLIAPDYQLARRMMARITSG